MTDYASHNHLPDPEIQPGFYQGVVSKRLVAFLIDLLVIFLLSLLVVPFTFFLGLFVFPALMAIVGFLYRLATIASGSATWGMRAMAIEFRAADGARFDGGLALLHTGGFYVSMAVFPLQLVSIVLMLMSERGQGLTDHLLGTVAVNRRAP